jgi:hypothetical protein
MYIKGKDGKKSTNKTSSLIWKERKGLEEKENIQERRSLPILNK